ncbi:Rpn family recombination-promoting nuclease/putative transposase [Aneurinibacillus aneurinilyticus]|jgi:predicted transposase YdaD|uniref:Transposase n=1 Tax=Aneurinibacillus aneurinilyticus TaxID=1391 RepID=A0A848CMN8_ANEAE|nr:Rpn family recombination-promoting nuclease/putative transposase [Aneurinibacillus aneurinilyticus]MCI1694305.1 Rpn family recombination-promoting nuclease/putative transposase [Aneurinibacillus aneurinilyticus]NME98594.1 transposase [Aneurinibacillus aneurinilyticus]
MSKEENLSDSQGRTDHDRLFKELLSTFFEEFMALFFPDAYEAIDFEHTSFLSEELFTDILKGEKRRVDLLVETHLRGEESLIIIHVEPQSYEQTSFHDRMFIYFSRLYEKYRRRILPIAIFSYDKVKEEPDTLHISFPFFNVMTFQFLKVELRRKNWRDYIQQDNPIAAALLSKMGYTPEERVEVKKEFLRMLVRLEQDPARMTLLTGFFETYLQLSEEEEQHLRMELQKLDPNEEGRIMELTTSWHEKGRREGKQEGRQEGRQEGKREAVHVLLQAKFGDAAKALHEDIQKLTKDEYIDELLLKVTIAPSLQEVKDFIQDKVSKQTKDKRLQ